MFVDKTFEDFIYLDSYCDMLGYDSVSLVDLLVSRRDILFPFRIISFNNKFINNDFKGMPVLITNQKSMSQGTELL
jgi:hypothetical protein